MIYLKLEYPELKDSYLNLGELQSQSQIELFINSHFGIGSSSLPTKTELSNMLLGFDKLILSSLSYSETIDILGVYEKKRKSGRIDINTIQVSGSNINDLIIGLNNYKDNFNIVHNISYINDTVFIDIIPITEVNNFSFNNFIRSYLIVDILQDMQVM